MRMIVTNNYSEPKLSPAKPESSDMSKHWYVWFRFFDSSTNKWKQLRYKKGINEFKVFKERLAEANALKQTLKEELRDGWNPLRKPDVIEIKIPSLKDAIAFILKIKSKSLRKKSMQTYAHITGLLLKWLVDRNEEDISIEKFTPAYALEYMDQLVMVRNYSGRTFNDHLVILSTFFNVIVKRKWASENPFKGIGRMKTTTGRNLAYSEEEKEALRKLLYKKDRWMYYFSQIMYFTFIRRTELARVKIGDIDFENKTIIIRGHEAKNDIQESVVIPKGLEPILKEMKLQHYPADHYVFGRHLFPSEMQYVNVDHISTRHNKFVRELNLDTEKGLYSWKHTGVCAAYYATGKDIYSVMRQLRHRDLNTTMIYLKSLGLIQNDIFKNSMVA